MPYRLGKGGKCGDTGWGVYKRDTGELVACHKTRRLAAAQFRLLEMITHEETKAATLKSWSIKYSEDQARDDHGRFGSGGGSSSDAPLSYRQERTLSTVKDKLEETDDLIYGIRTDATNQAEARNIYNDLNKALDARDWRSARDIAQSGIDHSARIGAMTLMGTYEKILAKLSTGHMKSAKYSEDQARDDHGRFGSGGGGESSPTAGSRGGAMASRAMRHLERSGATIDYLPAGEDQDKKEEMLSSIEEQYAAVMDSDDERITEGVSHMGLAISKSQEDDETHITTVLDKDGQIAGAAAFTIDEDSAGTFYTLRMFGTNGLVAGSGSALIAEIIREAFMNDAGFRVSQAEDKAVPFYKRIGLGKPINDGYQTNFEMSWEKTVDWMRQFDKESLR